MSCMWKRLYQIILDVNSFFGNIPLEETIRICAESIYDQNDLRFKEIWIQNYCS